ncbi:MAG: YbdK family carboxylate-amine ligase [Saprospiraceae bacterium]|jgi:carboxylate-amine ligase|nr:YbdK family carboxylate-amine ligase [Saprospiraceae bacterium]
MDFKQNDSPFTLGVEWELQVIDSSSYQLTPKALGILDAIDDPHFVKELFQSTLEINTDICQDVHDVRRNFEDFLPLLDPFRDRLGVSFASTGTHPISHFMDRLITPTRRYYEMIDRNQWLVRRMAVYGLHVHLGMLSGDHCINMQNFFLHLSPHLIALSASSPFWGGTHTGLASTRLTMYESMPTAGVPYQFESWKEFEILVDSLMRAKSIHSLKDLWWDFRPSPSYGTLEIRICDSPATLAELLALTAFIHTAAFWFQDHQEEWLQDPAHKFPNWVARENKWRAMRFGLEAEIVTSASGDYCSLRASLDEWLQRLQPYYDRLGYEDYLKSLHYMILEGNSASRQTMLYQLHHHLTAVALNNMQEFEARMPLTWAELRA